MIKYDLERGGAETHVHGPGRHGGEAVFAPRPGARDEDDGWLLVLDARRVADRPVARVLLPQRVPHGFHGIWLGKDPLKLRRTAP